MIKHQQLPIYLDYMATTPLDPRVVDQMMPYFTSNKLFGNASSKQHLFGRLAQKGIEQASEQVAQTINASSTNEIIWTSGATESNNLAIVGAASFYNKKGRHIISTTIEHKATLDALWHLTELGYDITLIKPQKNGLINIQDIRKAVRNDTILISIHHVNNEIGVIQDIASIGKIAKKNGSVFHVDAAQSPGKISLDVDLMNIDLLSLSAHKVYGPKGIGGLYIRKKPIVRINPIMYGGSQQYGIRPGTLPTPLIVGMGEAFFLAAKEYNQDLVKITDMYNTFSKEILKIPEVFLNGDSNKRVPHNINISIDGVNGEALFCALRQLAISTSSACTTQQFGDSHVLKEIGVLDRLLESSLRISIGRFTTASEINSAIDIITKQVKRLRNMAGNNCG